jgi:hypothetical protein
MQKRGENFESGQMPLALAPISQRVSSTLEGVKRNGQTLLSSAQLRFQQFSQEATSEEVLLGRSKAKADTSRRQGLRTSVSEANIQKPKFSRALIIAPQEGSPQIDWLGAFNQRINEARDKSRPKFQLPFHSEIGEQVSAASISQFGSCTAVATTGGNLFYFSNKNTHPHSFFSLIYRPNS